jgi:hypothetical protein
MLRFFITLFSLFIVPYALLRSGSAGSLLGACFESLGPVEISVRRRRRQFCDGR